MRSLHCTNFISQILQSGGWKYDNGLYFKNSNWWYGEKRQTWTWTGAENWSRFAPKRTSSLDNVWKLDEGDILQIDNGGDGTIDHTMFVTSKSSKMIYLTYHSRNTHDKSLKAILAGASPKAKFYAYNT